MAWVFIVAILICNAIMWFTIYEDRKRIYAHQGEYGMLVFGGVMASLFAVVVIIILVVTL